MSKPATVDIGESDLRPGSGDEIAELIVEAGGKAGDIVRAAGSAEPCECCVCLCSCVCAEAICLISAPCAEPEP